MKITINPALAALKEKAAAMGKAAVQPAAATAQLPAPSAQPSLLEPPVLPATPELEQQNPTLIASIQDLSNALHAAQPGIEFWLDRIHEQLRAYPELLHILTPEQVGAVCKAWQAKTQIAVVKAATKTRSSSKAAKLGAKLSDADL